MLSGSAVSLIPQHAARRIMDISRQSAKSQPLLSHFWSQGSIRHQSHASTPPFKYHLGASSCGKKAGLRPPQNGKTIFDSTLFTKRDPSFHSSPAHSGEDAFFMTHVSDSDRLVAFGIADGVGGWADSGVDPGQFSHGLCEYMAERSAWHHETFKDLQPRNLLQHAYDRVLANPKIEAGGSTACVGTLLPNGTADVANLGDSGFLILQPNKIAYKSNAQTHAFNTPYQLSKLTPRMRAQNAIFGNSAAISETPKDADLTTHQLVHGDVLVFASDGVWDNLSPIDTLNLVRPMMEQNGYWSATDVNADALRPHQEDKNSVQVVKDTPKNLAYAIMRMAKLAGMDTRRNGPFAKEVQRYYPGENWQGGKHDDVAVIVVLAIQDGPTKSDDDFVKAKL